VTWRRWLRFERTVSFWRLYIGERFLVQVMRAEEAELQELRPRNCTIPWPHEAPCNGWMCEGMRQHLRARAGRLEVPIAAGPRQEFRCDALHAATGARCELPPAHPQNHRGHKGHTTVQWPYPQTARR
jgi:hypothetical protein